jgi:hypothetical protein
MADMADEIENPEGGTALVATKKAAVRSTLGYPYFNLVDSIEVPKIIHEKAGGTCTPAQLVGLLGYKSVTSGTYQVRFSSARQFGLVRLDAGVISVTERAYKIFSPVMPEDSVIAKADAFLSVDLFRTIHDLFHGTPIPPEAGLRNLLLQRYGFSADRAGPAVRVLMESADQAGFFSVAGRSKLIYPPVAKGSSPEVKQLQAANVQEEPQISPEKTKVVSAALVDAPPAVHSAIIGLLRDLPSPGTVWPAKQKKRFVKAFQATLDFVYQSDEDDDKEEDR